MLLSSKIEIKSASFFIGVECKMKSNRIKLTSPEAFMTAFNRYRVNEEYSDDEARNENEKNPHSLY